MMEITIQVPDALGQQLQRYQGRLAEMLERGFREVAAEDAPTFEDVSAIVEVLASQPSPDQVLALRPSPTLQARVTALLDQSKGGALSPQEELELERYLLVEHLVRLAKAHAYQQRPTQG